MFAGSDEGALEPFWVSGWETCARGVALNGVSGFGVEDWEEGCCCAAPSRAVWCKQARCGRGAAEVIEDGAVQRNSEARLRSTERENIVADPSPAPTTDCGRKWFWLLRFQSRVLVSSRKSAIALVAAPATL